MQSLICLAVIGVTTAGVLHGVHGPALYAAAPAAYVAGHGAGHGDEGFDYYVSIQLSNIANNIALTLPHSTH